MHIFKAKRLLLLLIVPPFHKIHFCFCMLYIHYTIVNTNTKLINMNKCHSWWPCLWFYLLKHNFFFQREPCLRRTAVYDNDFLPIEHLYNHYVDERTSVLLAAGSSTYLYKLDTLVSSLLQVINTFTEGTLLYRKIY